MRFDNGRPGIGRAVVAGIIILVLVVVAVAAYLSVGGPSGTQTTSSQASTISSGASAGVLNITNMYADIQAGGNMAPASNSSSVSDKTTLVGTPGETFQVTFDVVYQLCAGNCPSQITEVIAKTPFQVVGATTPPMPVPVQGNIGVNMEATFLVTVKAPSTPYTGTLTLIAQGG